MYDLEAELKRRKTRPAAPEVGNIIIPRDGPDLAPQQSQTAPQMQMMPQMVPPPQIQQSQPDNGMGALGQLGASSAVDFLTRPRGEADSARATTEGGLADFFKGGKKTGAAA